MTNIQADHIGQDGIETLEDIVHIKQLVAERVREGGTLILNADDEQLVRMPQHPRVQDTQKTIVYFSLDPNNPHIRHHLAAGGTAFVKNGGAIEERNGHSVSRLTAVATIPATLAGTAEFQIYNVLAALAAARAAGVGAPAIVKALTEFALDRQSAGRVNLFAINDGYALIDYGHNPAALDAVCRTVAHWGATRVTQIIAVPGDRHDSLIKDTARAVHCVDRVIIREDDDLRGRRPGEVAHLLQTALREQRPHVPVRIILDELEAVSTGVREMQPGEVVVAFCDRVDAVITLLRKEGATPINAFQPFQAADAGRSTPAA
jgi:cyanophycin synthetase